MHPNRTSIRGTPDVLIGTPFISLTTYLPISRTHACTNKHTYARAHTPGVCADVYDSATKNAQTHPARGNVVRGQRASPVLRGQAGGCCERVEIEVQAGGPRSRSDEARAWLDRQIHALLANVMVRLVSELHCWDCGVVSSFRMEFGERSDIVAPGK